MGKFYYVDILCRNCGHREKMAIEKGVSVFDHVYNLECPNCGCKTLGQDYGKAFNGDVEVRSDHGWSCYLKNENVKLKGENNEQEV